MRIYPDLPAARASAIALDVLVLLMLWACLMLGLGVHDAVGELDVLGRGVEEAGTRVEDGFRDAGDAVDGAPVVGDDLDRALTRAGERAGEPVVRAGSEGREAVSDLAMLLGWLAGGMPALVVLLSWLPRRIAAARSLLAARQVMGTSLDDERRRLLAMRAAFSLPFDDLLQHTRDPFGDLAAGRIEPLLAAIGAEHGIHIPTATPAT